MLFDYQHSSCVLNKNVMQVRNDMSGVNDDMMIFLVHFHFIAFKNLRFVFGYILHRRFKAIIK